MLKGPAARRKAFVAETQSLCFESEFSSLESNERNLFQVAGTSWQVARNLAAMLTAPDAQGATIPISGETEIWTIETFVQSLETLPYRFESLVRKDESNERNLFRVASNVHQIILPWINVWET